jgi:hypothetical protein
MEIILDPTNDGLAMNQWAVQTLTWAYLATFPEAPPLRANEAASITWTAIVYQSRTQNGWGDLNIFDYNVALLRSVLRASVAIEENELAVPGVCRFCGCTMRYACVNDGRTCAWSESDSTICNAAACLDGAKRNGKPLINLAPPVAEVGGE